MSKGIIQVIRNMHFRHVHYPEIDAVKVTGSINLEYSMKVSKSVTGMPRLPDHLTAAHKDLILYASHDVYGDVRKDLHKTKAELYDLMHVLKGEVEKYAVLRMIDRVGELLRGLDIR